MKDVYARKHVLEVKHKELHNTIEALEAENAPDDIIHKKKKEKLKIKDELEKLKVSE